MARKTKLTAKQRLTAFHEAAHAVANNILGLSFEFVTINQTKEANGHVLTSIPLAFVRARAFNEWHNIEARQFAERIIIAMLAGPRAQQIQFPKSDIIQGGYRDFMEANQIANGLFDTKRERAKYLKQADARTDALIRKHKKQIERVANALLERETLTGAEVSQLIRSV